MIGLHYFTAKVESDAVNEQNREQKADGKRD